MYEEYGFYCNKLDTFTFEGASGMQKMNDIMDKMRTDYPKSVAGYKVIGFADYQASEKTDLASGAKETITLPKSNVISLYLENNNKAIIRPSGTEPKLKVYYTAVGSTMEEAEALQKKMSTEFGQLVK